MDKKITLTESMLRNIIRESVKEVLKEDAGQTAYYNIMHALNYNRKPNPQDIDTARRYGYSNMVQKLFNTHDYNPETGYSQVQDETPSQQPQQSASNGFYEKLLNDVKNGNLNYNQLAYLYSQEGAALLGNWLQSGKINGPTYYYTWKCIEREHS